MVNPGQVGCVVFPGKTRFGCAGWSVGASRWADGGANSLPGRVPTMMQLYYQGWASHRVYYSLLAPLQGWGFVGGPNPGWRFALPWAIPFRPVGASEGLDLSPVGWEETRGRLSLHGAN